MSAIIRKKTITALQKLEGMAEKAEKANAFTAIQAAKELARAQLELNKLIVALLVYTGE